ncbi:MAG: hypothetical protein Q7R63_01065 [bacterium]|nr:hypothetical protein [bacterium]
MLGYSDSTKFTKLFELIEKIKLDKLVFGFQHLMIYEKKIPELTSEEILFIRQNPDAVKEINSLGKELHNFDIKISDYDMDIMELEEYGESPARLKRYTAERKVFKDKRAELLKQFRKLTTAFRKKVAAYVPPPKAVGATPCKNYPKGDIDPNAFTAEFDSIDDFKTNNQSKLNSIAKVLSKEKQVAPILVKIGGVLVGTVKAVAIVGTGADLFYEFSVIYDPTGELTKSVSWANPLGVITAPAHLLGLGKLESVKSFDNFIATPGPLSVVANLYNEVKRHEEENYCLEIKNLENIISNIENNCLPYSVFGVAKSCSLPRTIWDGKLSDYKGDLKQDQLYFMMNNTESVARLQEKLGVFKEQLLNFKDKNKTDCGVYFNPPVFKTTPGYIK